MAAEKWRSSKSSYLEAVLESLRVYLVEGCFESVRYQLLYLREDVTVEVEVNIRLLCADHF